MSGSGMESGSRSASGGAAPDPLDELRAAVAAVRRQVERVRRRGANPEAGDWGGAGLRERLEGFDPLRAFDALRGRLPLRPRGSGEIDAFGFDAALLERARVGLDFLFDRWWRVHVSGADSIPAQGRVLFVANRSGILPYDGLMLAHAVERSRGPESRPRFLVADWLAALPFAQSLLARVGGVRACAENVERLLAEGRWVAAFPEGQKGAIKPFQGRYRLQRFARGGFVSIAVRQRAVIVPVAVVGAEEVHPILYQSSFLSRLLGVPALVTPTFPHLGALGLVPLPSRWRIRFGEPERFDDVPLERADDPLYVNRTRERIRSGIQALLDEEIRLRSSVF